MLVPSEETVRRAIEIARTGTAEYEYLFQNLQSAEWVEPLAKEGFFKTPIAPVYEGNYVSFPPWQESRYLARVADQDPAKVLEIAVQIPSTDNALVHQDLAQAACKMPGPLARAWALHELPWVTEQKRLFMLLPEELGRLVQHLAKTGEVDVALQLARVMLQVWLPEGAESTEPALRHPISRLDSWDYGEFLRLRIPTLLEAAPEATFRLLADILDEALRLGTEAESDEYGRIQDYTFISRPAVEEHPEQREQDHPGDLEIALLLALRDAGEKILSDDRASIEEVIGWLEEHAPLTFWRIALHLLRVFAGKPGTSELITERLVSAKYFDVIALHHEYLELLRAEAGSLSGEELDSLLSLIDASAEAEPDEGDANETLVRRETHKQRWLAELQTHLPEERLAELRALQAKYNERRLPDFHFGPVTGGFVGFTSPKTEEELEAMSPDEFLRFGQEWEEPAQSFFGETPSFEGLGKTLSAVVSKSPEKFASAAESFAALHPAYAWGYFEGLTAVTERGEPFEWEHPLRLMSAIAAHRDSDRTGLREPSWDWANRSALRVLEKGLHTQASGLNTGHRELVWDALVLLTAHPDPTPDYEEQYGGSNMDPLNLSINTIRGVAMSAVVEYAMWLHRNGELAHGFADAPEVAEVLSHHLDSEFDPSQAIRAVYGRWLPWLFLLDRDWARSNVHRILAEGGPLASAAWNTYVTYVHPLRDALPELHDYYAAAIEALPEHEDDKSGGMHSPNESMASHLMTYYWSGQLELDEGGLIDRFFQVGSPKTLGFAIDAVGRGLREGASSESNQRPMQLWEWRLSSGAITNDELEAFGWWAASPALEPDWMLRNLKIVLEQAKKVDAAWLVAERFAALVEEHGSLVIECLGLMIEGAPEPWSITHWEEEIRNVLSKALASADPEVQRAAYELTNLLGAKGHWGFSDLLP